MSKKHLPILLADRLYVPESKVTQEHLDAFTHVIERTTYVKEQGLTKRCGTCTWWMKPWKDDDGNKAFCHLQGYGEYDKCGDYEARGLKQVEEEEIHTYKRLRDEGYVAFARGDYEKLKRTFGERILDKAEDQRSQKRMGIPLEFGGPEGKKLYPEQKVLVKQWLKAGGGFLRSPTGTGKAVLASYLFCKLGLRTLVLASETRHLTTVMAEMKKSTNIDELQKEYDSPLMGIYSNEGKKRGQIFPITFATFQSLGSKYGKKELRKLRDKFGLVWIEELHRSAADKWFKTAATFNPLWRGGSSATPQRKDQMECVIFDSVGPVVAEGTAQAMTCEVTFIKSGVSVPDHALKRYGAYPWSGMLSLISNKRELLDAVTLNVISDIQKGYKPLVISERRNFAIAVHRELEALGFTSKLIMGGEKKAPKRGKEMFKDPWKPINEALGNGSLQAVIGTGVMNEAVNIPNLSALHLPHPSANPIREEQRAGRINRVVPGKPTPQIRVYTFDGASIASTGCRKTRMAVYTRLGFRFKGDRGAAENTSILRSTPDPSSGSPRKIRSLDALPSSRASRGSYRSS